MIKVVSVEHFGRELSTVERRRRWSETDLPLIDHPDLCGYVRSFAAAGLFPEDPTDVPPLFDSYSCYWFTDQAGFSRFSQDVRAHRKLAASDNVLAPPGATVMSALVEEQPIIEGESGPVKAVWFMRFKEEVRRDPAKTLAAHARWTGSHGKSFGVRVPGIGRYVQNHVAAEPAADGSLMTPPEFCGFSECWFADRVALELTLSSPEWAAMNADARDLFDSPWSIRGNRAVLEERTLKSPPALSLAR